jgi:hypothetical protein
MSLQVFVPLQDRFLFECDGSSTSRGSMREKEGETEAYSVREALSVDAAFDATEPWPGKLAQWKSRDDVSSRPSNLL